MKKNNIIIRNITLLIVLKIAKYDFYVLNAVALLVFASETVKVV